MQIKIYPRITIQRNFSLRQGNLMSGQILDLTKITKRGQKKIIIIKAKKHEEQEFETQFKHANSLAMVPKI